MTDSRFTTMASSLAAAVDVIGDVMVQLALLAEEDPQFSLPVQTAMSRADKQLSGAWDQGEKALNLLRTAERIENEGAA